MEENLGKVSIAPNVLVTIVQKTAGAMPGVDRLSDNVPGVKRFLGLETAARGVQVGVVESNVSVDVYLVARRGIDLLQMGRQLQSEITRAIEDIVGMSVREVNVHIEDVATELAGNVVEKKERAR
ncbi:MAG: Asp23/Gls24 family envelope stress response protein [Anaerolineae bacterium]|nr:Asp23/Gls24 family envelope stress response protein [Anaerolineae bacterium]MDX9829171.1 Asp23/Gls24 family envelope stress response protein [Anaerolineae bacterium]